MQHPVILERFVSTVNGNIKYHHVVDIIHIKLCRRNELHLLHLATYNYSGLFDWHKQALGWLACHDILYKQIRHAVTDKCHNYSTYDITMTCSSKICPWLKFPKSHYAACLSKFTRHLQYVRWTRALGPINLVQYLPKMCPSWWRHQMETFSALLAICAGNSPHKDHWRGALMFSLMCAWING